MGRGCPYLLVQQVSDLVDRAVQGESVCIYSCGQSGSGKTAVLAGLQQADEEKTVACRAVERLLQAADAARDEGWEYSITASLLVRPSPRAPSRIQLRLFGHCPADN